MTNYELCHASYRGNIEKEIDAAHEVLRKYKKSCVDAVKELRYETDMPMTECSNMLRCLQRDAEIERIQVENAKLRELVRDMWRFTGAACKKYPRLFDPAAQGGQMVQLNAIDNFEQRMRELGVDA